MCPAASAGRLASPIGSRLLRELVKAFSGNTRDQRSARAIGEPHAGGTVLQREVERGSIRDQPCATAILHVLSNEIAELTK
jgi:hypothetical protein